MVWPPGAMESGAQHTLSMRTNWVNYIPYTVESVCGGNGELSKSAVGQPKQPL